MPIEHLRYIAEPAPSVVFESQVSRTVPVYDGEQTKIRLREALARGEVLRRKNHELIRKSLAGAPCRWARPDRLQPWIYSHIKENVPMSHIRLCLTAIVLAAVASSSVVAQTPGPQPEPAPAASAPDSSKPSTATQVETWTRKKWEAAKREWAKDKAKWADCRKQSSEQNLKGRKSWSFLYTCMTS